MSAGLGSILSSPAAGMSPLRAAAAVVSDGGGEIVASPRWPQVDEEDLNRNQRHDAEQFLQTVRSATLCGQRVGIIHHQAAYRLALQGSLYAQRPVWRPTRIQQKLTSRAPQVTLRQRLWSSLVQILVDGCCRGSVPLLVSC